jgi:ParB family transcriptional regulator, chromosome partitioning protein
MFMSEHLPTGDSMAEQTVTDIPTDRVDAGDNDRHAFDPQALANLAESISESGLAQPITVRPIGDRYQIVAGERRFRAVSTILGWTTIPALVRDLDDERTDRVMLVENTGRENLNPVEEALAYRQRIDRYGWDVDKVARIAGVTPTVVRYRLELLDLSDDTIDAVRQGTVTVGFAQLMVGLDSNRQRVILRTLASRDLSWNQLRDLCNRLRDEQDSESQSCILDLDEFLVAQEAAGAMEAAARRATRAKLLRLVSVLADAVGPDHPAYAEAMAALTNEPKDNE